MNKELKIWKRLIYNPRSLFLTRRRRSLRRAEGTIVTHKTGTSGTNDNNVTAAINDIGIIILPTGNPFFISVLVSNSAEDMQANEKIISDITKKIWDYYSKH